jgi:hypothetical protein
MKRVNPPLTSGLVASVPLEGRLADRPVEIIVDELVAEHFHGVALGETTRIPQRYPGQPHTCIVRDHSDRPLAALQVSDHRVPDMVERSVDKLCRIREVIGATASSHLLAPMASGWRHGCSYVVYPYCSDLHRGRIRSAVERRLLAGPLLDWLFEFNRRTLAPCTTIDRSSLFGLRLEALAEDVRVATNWRRRAAQARHALVAGTWSPSTVMMHGDLWVGNVMVSAPHGDYRSTWVRTRFKVIDWPGCLERGYACFDLYRIAYSLGFGPRQPARENRRHAALLNDSPAHASHYLSAAYGQILMTLENFPIEEFNKMAATCEQQLQSLGL